MPVDYSKFKDIEDSDEEPIYATDNNARSANQKVKQLPKKAVDAIEEGARQIKGRTVHCFMEFEIDTQELKKYKDEIKSHVEKGPYRVIFEINQTEHAPKACENFRSLCTGERGTGVGQNKLHYKGRSVQYVLPKFCTQVGIPNEYSCFGTYLKDEKLKIPGVNFEESGVLCCGNHGPNTITCTFMVTLNRAEHLYGYNQIIGRVIRGMEFFRIIERLPTDNKEKCFLEKDVKSHWGGKPMASYTIVNCGEIMPDQLEKELAIADGDPYPEFPEDVSATADKEKLLETAIKIKEVGNTFFKKKEYGTALEKYVKSLRYIQPLWDKQHRREFEDDEPREWMGGSLRPKDRTDIVREHFTIKLNVVQVNLSLKNWKEAIMLADDVLVNLKGRNTKKGHGAYPNDPITVKALYRRARGYVGQSEEKGELKMYDEALEDLKQALFIDPDNEDLKAYKSKVEADVAAIDARAKHMCEKMVNAD